MRGELRTKEGALFWLGVGLPCNQVSRPLKNTHTHTHTPTAAPHPTHHKQKPINPPIHRPVPTWRGAAAWTTTRGPTLSSACSTPPCRASSVRMRACCVLCWRFGCVYESVYVETEDRRSPVVGPLNQPTPPPPSPQHKKQTKNNNHRHPNPNNPTPPNTKKKQTTTQNTTGTVDHLLKISAELARTGATAHAEETLLRPLLEER